jgi:RimJ/RimL family protein N-acetyltransferase
MKLAALTLEQCEQVRQWRNQDISMYRTPYLFTEDMQADFYRSVVCNRLSVHRYYAIMDGKTFIGMAGLVGISWENRSAEISLVLSPFSRGAGNGAKAVELILDEAFNNLNIENVYGECYFSSPAMGFWKKIVDKLFAEFCIMPKRKFHGGKYHDSLYFNINRGEYHDYCGHGQR